MYSECCQVLSTHGENCRNCGRLKSVNSQNQRDRSKRESIKCQRNKRFLSREELLEEIREEQQKGRNAELRANYWQEKFNSEAIEVDKEDHADLISMFKDSSKEDVFDEMACLWEQQSNILQTMSKNGHRWHSK